MYTEIIPAIYENLSDLYFDLTDAKKIRTDLTGSPVNSHEIDRELIEYTRIAVNWLLNRDDSRLLSQIEPMINLCNKGLDLTYCRVDLYGITGFYAVQLDLLKRVKAMVNCSLPLPLPKYGAPNYKFLHEYKDTFMIISVPTIEFHKYHVVFDLWPELYCLDDSICNHVRWNDCISYERLADNERPYFMSFERYQE